MLRDKQKQLALPYKVYMMIGNGFTVFRRIRKLLKKTKPDDLAVVISEVQRAIRNTSDTKIKDFASMMVKDHGKANEELMAIAHTKNITLPTALDDEHQKTIGELAAKSGGDFDKTYVDAMIDGHKKTLKLMEDEAKDGKDTDLRAFAAKTAPIVQSHLNTINKIREGMK